ncbi:response regulator [candidate division KSB1 bacterium]|nr:response regulator [candidate division KSB1 bacterium]
MKARILIIDDEKHMCSVLKTALESDRIDISVAYSGEQALSILDEQEFSIVISDIKMPGLSGLDILKRIKKEHPATEVLLMTAYADAQTAVDAMKNGAYDYIIKPFEVDELRHKVQNIIQKTVLVSENKNLKAELQKRYSLDRIVGRSRAMQRVYELVEKVARSDAIVLIRGESGTGKEVVARAIHNLGHRRVEPFVAVNCAALPDTLLESELFGHEKGAFTGAEKRKLGRFELAQQGTIFLDEIGDINQTTQIKLLRVLQNREIERLGGEETIPIEARTIAATNQDLEKAVREKKIREDLYYRINVFPLFLPPLRDRKEDIPDLVGHFLEEQNAEADIIGPKTMTFLIDYDWPGNIRELENVIRRALIMSGGENIKTVDLPPHIRGEAEMPLPGNVDDIPTLNEMEKHMIRRALDKADGNKTMAANLLGITRRQLYSKMERLFGVSDL